MAHFHVSSKSGFAHILMLIFRLSFCSDILPLAHSKNKRQHSFLLHIQKKMAASSPCLFHIISPIMNAPAPLTVPLRISEANHTIPVLCKVHRIIALVHSFLLLRFIISGIIIHYANFCRGCLLARIAC